MKWACLVLLLVAVEIPTLQNSLYTKLLHPGMPMEHIVELREGIAVPRMVVMRAHETVTFRAVGRHPHKPFVPFSFYGQYLRGGEEWSVQIDDPGEYAFKDAVWVKDRDLDVLVRVT